MQTYSRIARRAQISFQKNEAIFTGSYLENTVKKVFMPKNREGGQTSHRRVYLEDGQHQRWAAIFKNVLVKAILKHNV